MPTEEGRWAYLVSMDDELLVGGVILSEWSVLIIRETDTAFVKGAHLAAILTAVSAIESHLRAEIGGRRDRLATLIEQLPCSDELRADLHQLRRYRNTWVHVDPDADEAPLEDPQSIDGELERMASFAVRVLRRTIYSNPML
jgi:hypothetical protein